MKESPAEREQRIRGSVLVPPDDLRVLREALDLGHNITRSDGYALLNYIERRLNYGDIDYPATLGFAEARITELEEERDAQRVLLLETRGQMGLPWDTDLTTLPRHARQMLSDLRCYGDWWSA